MPTKNPALNDLEKKKSCEDPNQQQRSHAPDSIGVALRKHGIDEHTIAETLAYTRDALKGIVPVKDSDKKLLIEFVKECTKLLKGDAEAAVSAPVQVRLIHNVARPNRGGPSAQASDTSANSEASAGNGGPGDSDGEGGEEGEVESDDSTPRGTLLN